MRIKCPRCDFETAFIRDGDILRRDVSVHGNSAATQTCFNCNTALTITPPAPRPVVAETEPPKKKNKLFLNEKKTKKKR